MSPLVSIIIPTYNCCSYLKDCLGALEKINQSAIEVIVINDGSKDDTETYLNSVIEKHPTYKIKHQKNGGLSNARNAGLDLATGKYIYFSDSDDEIIPEAFNKMIEILKNHDFDILVANFLNQQPDFKTSKVYYERSKLGDTTGEDFLLHSLRAKEYGSEVVQYFIKRHLFSSLRFKEGILHEDDQLIPRILFRANKVHVTEENIYFRKYRSGSLTRSENASTRPRRNPKDILLVIQTYEAEMRDIQTKKAKKVFKTFQIRSWLSMLDYLKHETNNKEEYINQKPNPWKILADNDVLWSYRVKYFRRNII